jgi:rubredoxin
MVCSLCGYERKKGNQACTVCGGRAGSALPTGLKRTQSTPHAEKRMQLACVDLAELLAQAGITDKSNKQRGMHVVIS